MTFQINPGVKKEVPLLLGLAGPSGSGKTYSALTLAEGIKDIKGGPIVVIDTENNRALHYADKFDFLHLPFEPPFRSARYKEAIEEAEKLNPSCIVIDSLSHEHEGEGGLNDHHAECLQEMIDRAKQYGNKDSDWVLENKYNMQAWRDPKQGRGKLRSHLTRSKASIIMCFRTKETSKPQRNDKGKMEVVDMGFTTIGGPEFIFEATVSMLFMPCSGGVPTWSSEKQGERLAIKRPDWASAILRNDQQVTREHGRLLATWAKGTEPESGLLQAARNIATEQGREALIDHMGALSDDDKAALQPYRKELWSLCKAKEPA